MKFVIITHVNHVNDNGKWYGYAPYVREMNIWLKHVDEVIIVAPSTNYTRSDIDLAYEHHNITFIKVPLFDVTSVNNALRTLVKLPVLWSKIYRGCAMGDHIHLRCPGNMGLLGSMVQVFFPAKKKTAKYAGNWDPESKQPWSYKWQRAILKNPTITRNMQILVYGNWPNSTVNVKPFFTATYQEADKKELKVKSFSGSLKMLFVGTLSPGKQPLYVIQLMEQLKFAGIDVSLDIYGNGVLLEELQHYVANKQLNNDVSFMGNKPKEIVEDAYKKAHFMVLPSKSEGWPKVVAEAMFWGCLPIATKVSCVPYMLDYGNRGVLLEENLQSDVAQIKSLIANGNRCSQMMANAVLWSRKYTLDYFEQEIKELV